MLRLPTRLFRAGPPPKSRRRGDSPSSAVQSQTPVFQSIPTISFTNGVSTNIDVGSYVSDPNGDLFRLYKNAQSLPSGVIYNEAMKRFEYDGAGAVGGTDGHILTADDFDGVITAIVTQNPQSTINVARGATALVAKAYKTDGTQPIASFVFASTGASRSIPDLTLSYSLSSGEWSISVTALVGAALTTYTDFGLDIT